MAEEEKIKSSVQIKQDIPEQFESNLEAVKDYAKRTSRDGEFGFTTQNGNVTLKRDGQINLSSGIDSQFKMSNSGSIESISLNNFVKTNNFKIDADDIVINNHKLNNKIFELADFKNVLKTETSIEQNKVAGGLTMLGTVLTKTWDKYLKRYVMIRRLVNIPVFSPSMGATDVHPGLQLTPSTTRIQEMQQTYKQSGTSIENYLSQVEKAKAAQKTSSATKTTKDNKNATKATTKEPAKSMTDLTGQKRM